MNMWAKRVRFDDCDVTVWVEDDVMSSWRKRKGAQWEDVFDPARLDDNGNGNSTCLSLYQYTTQC